jgi:hypothetical protein
MNDQFPGGQVYEALLSVLVRELWPRTLADIGASRTMPYVRLVEAANREVPPDPVPNHRIITDLMRAAEQVCKTNSIKSKESLARAVTEARAFGEWERSHNVEMVDTGEDPFDTKIAMRGSNGEARLNLGHAPTVEQMVEDPFDTKIAMRGSNGEAGLNLGHAPTVEQMVEAMISTTETASGKPADLRMLLNYFKDAAAYLEKRIASGATRRLRIVKKDQP